MSERFFDKFLSFFFGFIVLLIMVLSGISSILLWISSHSLVFYYGYVASLGLSVFYGIKLYLRFQDFRENLNLFLPNNSERQLEPLNLDIPDLPLKVCLYYRNGATLKSMKEDFGFTHPNQVRRKLVEGLDILLKFYKQHKENTKE
jgi:hypothetical protein